MIIIVELAEDRIDEANAEENIEIQYLSPYITVCNRHKYLSLSIYLTHPLKLIYIVGRSVDRVWKYWSMPKQKTGEPEKK